MRQHWSPLASPALPVLFLHYHIELPIIAMTTNGVLGDREKVPAVGMNDYIAKLSESHQLFEALAK
ncbi:MAG: hypothetical protein EP323_09690 [Gammaproteobacteria bacterium]|nr:MAG: hypothetical protein EP323_09690 [Gammaproteobacteria bacterium]